MNSWMDAPWRGGRAGGYSRRPLEGDPMNGSTSKSVRGAPEPRHPSGKGYCLIFLISSAAMSLNWGWAAAFSAISKASVLRPALKYPAAAS